MTLGRLVLGATLALGLGAAAQAEELKLSEQQLDQVTAGGPTGDALRAGFVSAVAFPTLFNGFAGGIGGGQAAAGISVLVDYVALEIFIAQNRL